MIAKMKQKQSLTKSLFFVALLPPEQIREEVTQIKQEFAARYDSCHALKSPPHITLHMPFKWREQRLPRLREVLQGVASQQVPFELCLQDFDCFAPRVIFVDVLPQSALVTLQQQLTRAMRHGLHLLNADYKDRPFHPHMTVAFRDLKKPAFALAWQEFESRSYTACFEVNALVLLRHDGQRWQEHEAYPFSP